MEEVRRELIKKFGEEAKDGPNSLYGGGLWVRSSMDPVMQDAAAQALRDGLTRFDGGRGWSDLGMKIDLAKNWAGAARRGAGRHRLSRLAQGGGAQKGDGQATIGFANGTTGVLNAGDAAMPKRGVGGRAFDFLEPGHGHHRQADRRRQLRAALDPRGLGRNAGGRSAHRPGHGDAGRVRRRRLELQPRDPGAAPAGLGVQADRLRDRAPERLHARDDRAGCAVLRLAGRGARPEMLRQFRPPLGRAAHAALGRRAVAQPDDGARRLDRRHAEDHRDGAHARRRRLWQLSVVRARRRRHDRVRG